MISQTEIPGYIAEELPELSQDLAVTTKSGAFAFMKTLLEFTFKSIRERNYNIAKRCFHVAARIYEKGNATVKNAVQNVFVYSFTRMFQLFPLEKEHLMAIIPVSLYTLYIAQVHHAGC